MKGIIVYAVCVILAAVFPAFSQIPEAADVQAPGAEPALTVMTQTVFRTQFAAPVLNAGVPGFPARKAWLFPGVGQIGLGEKTRGVVQAGVFSAAVAASASFFIAGAVNFNYCQEKYAAALETIDYSARSNLLVQRDRYYNKYNILTSYAEASLIAAAVVYAYSIFDFYYTRGKRLRPPSVSLFPGRNGLTLAYAGRF